jgi:FdhD protein
LDYPTQGPQDEPDCGVCGKGAIDEVTVRCAPLGRGPRVAPDLLARLPDALQQPGFRRTGRLNATGLFDEDGAVVCVREDVGRDNAMDKVIGWALVNDRVPLSHALLCASGRLSFELVQKATVAGATILVGVGAPTSLAVGLAQARDLTLGGFARGGKINIYAASHRCVG